MEHPKKKRVNFWVMALIASVAVNGLFAGYYLANKTSAPIQNFEQAGEQQRGQQRRATMPRHANRLVRHLPRQRQKEIMRAAFDKLPKSETQNPRRLMQERGKLQQKLNRAMRQDAVDDEILQSILAETRVLNETLALQSDALVVAIIAEMTPEERQQIRSDRRRNQRRRK